MLDAGRLPGVVQGFVQPVLVGVGDEFLEVEFVVGQGLAQGGQLTGLGSVTVLALVLRCRPVEEVA